MINAAHRMRAFVCPSRLSTTAVEFPGWGGTVQELDFTGLDTSGSYEAHMRDQRARERTVELG